MAARKPRDKQAPAPKVGDRVLCTAPEPWLSGVVVKVIGLAVLSCQGRTGVAVQYSTGCYAVVRPEELEPTR